MSTVEQIKNRWAHAKRVDAGTHWADVMPGTAIEDVKALLAEVERLTRELRLAKAEANHCDLARRLDYAFGWADKEELAGKVNEAREELLAAREAVKP